MVCQKRTRKENKDMRPFSPRPVIVRVHHTWSITPGMSFSVVEDIERKVWIVESCPAGAQYWNLAQASMLTGGDKTGDPLEAAIVAGSVLQNRLDARRIARKSAPKFGKLDGRHTNGAVRTKQHASIAIGSRRDREMVGA